MGIGAVEPSILGVTLGTAGIVAATINEFQINPGGTIQFFCNVIPDSWVAFGTTLAAGGSLRWVRDIFASSERELAKVASPVSL